MASVIGADSIAILMALPLPILIFSPANETPTAAAAPTTATGSAGTVFANRAFVEKTKCDPASDLRAGMPWIDSMVHAEDRRALRIALLGQGGRDDGSAQCVYRLKWGPGLDGGEGIAMDEAGRYRPVLSETFALTLDGGRVRLHVITKDLDQFVEAPPSPIEAADPTGASPGSAGRNTVLSHEFVSGVCNQIRDTLTGIAGSTMLMEIGFDVRRNCITEAAGCMADPNAPSRALENLEPLLSQLQSDESSIATLRACLATVSTLADDMVELSSLVNSDADPYTELTATLYDPKVVVHDAVASVQGLSDLLGVGVRFDFPFEEKRLWGHPTAVRRALVRLLDDIMRFGRLGSGSAITVMLELEDVVEDMGFAKGGTDRMKVTRGGRKENGL
ncbi:hypothetical protein HK101_010585, partial [Irineochytrium annulatum]